MKITVQTTDGKIIILEESFVCWLQELPDDVAEIHLVNGEILLLKNPPYHEWANDVLVGK